MGRYRRLLLLGIWSAASCLAGGPAAGHLTTAGAEGTGSLRDLPLAAQFAISAALGREEAAYHAVPADCAGFSAANPAQGFTAKLTGGGFTVEAGEVRWGLSLVGAGCDGRIEKLPSASPAARGNRVELRRGPIVEWYENGPLGLQQGFTLQAAPRGCTGSEALQLVLAPVGSLSMEVQDGGRGLIARGEKGPALAYRGLAAFEDGGREVPARLALESGRVVLEVSARARFPLVLGPFVEVAKLTASDGAGLDLFGQSVAIDGDTVVVGAHFGGAGKAYVFVEPPGGWPGALVESAKLTASDGEIGDQFGISVSISGDTAVVGADGDDFLPAGGEQGSAYVFVEPPGGWAGSLDEDAKLTASDGAVGDLLGASVAISGDTVAAGARGDTSQQGSVYVFVEPMGGWAGALNEDAKLTASDGGGVLGTSVAVDGDTVVGGAPFADSTRGAAYLYLEPMGGWTGALTENAKLLASDGATGDELGSAAAISGGTVVVGAHKDDANRGSAYVFVEPPGGWAGTLSETEKLIASDGTGDEAFGRSAAISGDTMVVGSPLDDLAGNDQGSAYVFQGSAGSVLGVPALSPAGLGALVLLLVLAALWTMARRRP